MSRTAEECYYLEKARREASEKKLATVTSALEETKHKLEKQSELLREIEYAYDPTSKATKYTKGASNLVNCSTTSNNRTNLSRWVAQVWKNRKELPPELKLKEHYTVDVEGSICQRLTKITTTPRGQHPLPYYFSSTLPIVYDLMATRRSNVTSAIRSVYECKIFDYIFIMLSNQPPQPSL